MISMDERAALTQKPKLDAWEKRFVATGSGPAFASANSHKASIVDGRGLGHNRVTTKRRMALDLRNPRCLYATPLLPAGKLVPKTFVKNDSVL